MNEIKCIVALSYLNPHFGHIFKQQNGTFVPLEMTQQWPPGMPDQTPGGIGI
jgi:hypothetical protein